MIPKFLTIISICLLVSNVYTESVEATEIKPLQNNSQGFLTANPNFSIDINKIIICGSTLTGVVQKAIVIIQDIGTNPQNLLNDILQLSSFYQEIVRDCTGIFNVSKIQKLKFGGIPAVGDIIACIKTIKPLAVDIKNAVENFKKGDTAAGLENIEQATIDAVSFGFSCYKVIEEILA